MYELRPFSILRLDLALADLPHPGLSTPGDQGKVTLASLSSFPKPGIFVDAHRAACLAALGDGAALTVYRKEPQKTRSTTARWRPAAWYWRFWTDSTHSHGGSGKLASASLQVALPSVLRIGGTRAQRRIVSETPQATRVRHG